jgi:hypothetical protein
VSDENDAWIAEVPRPELNAIHFALRLIADKPGLDMQTKVAMDSLADRFWAEGVRRQENETSRRENGNKRT